MRQRQIVIIAVVAVAALALLAIIAGGGGRLGGTSAETPTEVSAAPTQEPPTAEPPTAEPPTAEPPTAVPPTDVPPTDVPPTDVPPTDVPPTDVPPTDVPPTDIPPTDVPPTDVPTEVAPTVVPPTEVPTEAPTEVPPTDVPTEVPTETLAIEKTLEATPLGAQAIPANDPLIVLSVTCNPDLSATFIISNAGGPMVEAGNYTFTDPANPANNKSASFQLNSGESISLSGSGSSSVNLTYSTSVLESVNASATGTCLPTTTPTFTPSGTALPTNTRTPTVTPGNTLTPSLTFTPSLTNTPAATSTTTNTPTITLTPSLMPCGRPDCSSLSISGVCTGGLVIFTIVNTGEPGNGDMISPTQLRLYVNGTLVDTQSIQLKGGDNYIYQWEGGGDVRMEVDQQPWHPGSSRPNASVSGCATNTPTVTFTPSMTRTPRPTRTPTNTRTQTPLPTSTGTATLTPTAVAEPNLSLGVNCNADLSATFFIINNGPGDMTSAGTYTVDEVGKTLQSQSFTLNAGQSLSISAAGNAIVSVTYSTPLRPYVFLSAQAKCIARPTLTPTSTVLPSNTPRPTNTPTNTELPTHTPTNTALPTSTPTNTETPTLTSTPQADLSITGSCVNFVASFTITNNGGAQSQGSTYSITDAQGNELGKGTFTLGSAPNNSTTVTAQNAFGDVTINVVDLDLQKSSSFVVNCGMPTATPSNTPTFTPTFTNTPQADLSITGSCVNFVASFTITNNGGAQSQGSTYSITDAQGNELGKGTFNLGSAPNNSTTVTAQNAFGDVTINVVDLDLQKSSSFVVNCGMPTATPSNTPTFTPTFTSTPEQPGFTPSAKCAENKATFIIENTGGDMPRSDTYTVTDKNGNVLAQGQFQLKKGEQTTVDVPNVPPGAELTLKTGTTGINVTAVCTEPVSTPPTPVPTGTPVSQLPSPTPTYECGETVLDENGFPIVNPEPCEEDNSSERVTWVPIQPGAGVCPDWLLYHTRTTGDWEVFRLGELPEEPGAPANLTQRAKTINDDESLDVAPARSPDSKWVAFASNRDGNWEIYVVGSNGKNLQRMTRNRFAMDIDPVWSPDGTRIVYESVRAGNWDLFMFDVTTGVETRLTRNPAQDINAFFTPDGRKLVFQSSRDGQWQIYELNLTPRADGTFEEKLLSDGQGDDIDPQVSADGTMIAFRSIRGGNPNSVIYWMKPDGTEVKAISDPAGEALNHAYSADSTLIAYQMTINGKRGIYVYQFATDKTRKVTDDQTDNFAPTWYCKGPTVVWTSNAQDNLDIYATNALPIDAEPIDVKQNGSQLTTADESDVYPQNTPAEENASRGKLLPTVNRR